MSMILAYTIENEVTSCSMAYNIKICICLISNKINIIHFVIYCKCRHKHVFK